MFEVTYLFLVCGVRWQNNVHKGPSGTPGWLRTLGNFTLYVRIILRQQKSFRKIQSCYVQDMYEIRIFITEYEHQRTDQFILIV